MASVLLCKHGVFRILPVLAAIHAPSDAAEMRNPPMAGSVMGTGKDEMNIKR